VFAPDFKTLGEFAVIYLILIDNKPFEVVRYDCGKNEAVNVHQFYRKPTKKRYLDKEKSLDTVQDFMESIEKNWRTYRQKFLEK